MAHYLKPLDATQQPAWQALRTQRERMQQFSLRDAFAADPQRFKRYSLSHGGLFLDYSKNLIDEQSLAQLLQLAEQMQLRPAIEALFAGARVNASEGRPALHTALRRPVGERVLVDGVDVMPQVHRVLGQMTELVQRIHNALWRGYTEKPITDVVNIGIGGSFLGPQLVSEALLPFAQRTQCGAGQAPPLRPASVAIQNNGNMAGEDGQARLLRLFRTKNRHYISNSSFSFLSARSSTFFT